MFNLQGSEIIMILLIALVVLGPERLPDAVRRFMQTYHELRKMGSGFQSEIKSAFDEPMRELRDTAQSVRNAADPSKFMAEAQAEERIRADADAATESTPDAHADFAPPTDHASSNGASNGVVDPGDVVASPGFAPPRRPVVPQPLARTPIPSPASSSAPPPPPPPPPPSPPPPPPPPPPPGSAP